MNKSFYLSGSDLDCSFCGKSREEIKVLVAAPGASYICNECIALCNDILAEHEIEVLGVSGRVAGIKEAILFLLEKSAECEKVSIDGSDVRKLGATLFGISGAVALRLAAVELAKKIGDAELEKKAEEVGK